MFERFTDDAKRALFVARQNAWLDGSSFIEPHHLLHALLAESDPTLRDVLARLDVPAGRVRNLLPPIPDSPRNAGDPRHREIPFSDAFKQLLTLGADEADTMRSVEIRPGHLLLGLLRIEGAAPGALARSGVHIEAARIVVGRAAGSAG